MSGSAPPISAPASVEPSDEFWGLLLVEGMEAELYSSLASMTRASDAIVIGRVQSVVEGLIGDARTDPLVSDYVTVMVSVERCILWLRDGCPSRVPLEFFVPSTGRHARLLELVPAERALMFIRDKGVEARSLGLDAATTAGLTGRLRLVSTQGVLRDDHGRVKPPLLIRELEPFLAGLEGRDFGRVLSEIEGSLSN